MVRTDRPPAFSRRPGVACRPRATRMSAGPGQPATVALMDELHEDAVADQELLAHVDLARRVPAWLDWAEAARRLDVPVSKVRQMIKDHELAGAVPTPGTGQRVPADFIVDGLVLKGLPGLLTVLHDAGYDDREAIAWIYQDMDLPGRPIDALLENRGSEVKRRAQALGF